MLNAIELRLLRATLTFTVIQKAVSAWIKLNKRTEEHGAKMMVNEVQKEKKTRQK